MKTKYLFYTGLLVGLILAVNYSCKYDDVLPVPIDPGIQISFSQDVVPIFVASCNKSGCHNGSGPSPDLRASVAYESLWSGGLIDTMTVENSGLYLWMNGLKGLPMPIEGVNSGYVATVLQWIEQGAKNN